MRASFTSIAAFVGLVAALPQGETGPDPNDVHFKDVQYSGTGCPAGSAALSMQSDGKAFTLGLDAYVVQSGAGISPIENRKNCNLNVELYYPQGWQYSIITATYRGYAALDKDTIGTQKSTYWFTGSGANGKQMSTQSPFPPNYNGDYKFSDKIDSTTVVWSPCGKGAARGRLNINSQIRVERNPKSSKIGTGLLTVDTIDGVWETKCQILWRWCGL